MSFRPCRLIGEGFALPPGVRFEKQTFGPVLRAARVRQGVTLKELAKETKVGVDLWAALENSNVSRWPKQVFARSYIRDYAIRVGLDGDEVVNEFCRLFPECGERRSERIMRGQAEIIDHRLNWEDLPTEELRRATDRMALATPDFLIRLRLRILAVLFDLTAMLALARVGMLLNEGFWPSFASSAVAYTSIATLLAGRSFGLIAAEWVIKTVRSFADSRRLVSSRVHGA